MSQNISKYTYKPKGLIYVARVIKEKGRIRFRLTPVPEEASKRFLTEQNSREIIVTVRKPQPIRIPLPYHMIKYLKDVVFKYERSKEDLKLEVAFVTYEYINTVLHVLGMDSITVMYYDPKIFEVKKENIMITPEDRVTKVSIKASGFTLLPFEIPTSNIEFHGEFYNIKDEFDYESFTSAYFIVDLYRLMKEDLKTRWDIGYRY